MKTFNYVLIILASFSFIKADRNEDRRLIRRSILLSQDRTDLDSGASYYGHKRRKRSLYEFEENDLEGSGSSGEEDNTELPTDDSFEDQEDDFNPRSQDFGWHRAKINFMDSIRYNEELSDQSSQYFSDISFEIMTTIERYLRTRLGAYSEATPIMYRRDENDVIATVDIGMCGSEDLELLQPEIESLLTSGVLASFRVTLKKFNMKNLGIDPNRPECYAKNTENSNYNEETNLSEQIDVTTTTEKISTTTTTEPTSTTRGKYYIDYNNYYDYDDEYNQVYDDTMISLEDIDQPDFLAGNDKPPRKFNTEDTLRKSTTTTKAPKTIKKTTTRKQTTTTLRPTSTAQTYNQPCGPDQATCRNLQCIDRKRICDGTPDCLDGSDEPATCDKNLDEHRKCHPEEFMCVGTGECKQLIWKCDGDNDCMNGFDEQECPAAKLGESCQGTEFQCHDDGLCIPKSYLCDGESDCNDASDEQGCAKPEVTELPRRFVNATEGDEVILHCKSIGFPTPVVTWRLNWDNVPSPPRVTMTSVDGTGTLTIRNIQLSDQGAYSCQAINAVGTKLATPDSIVSVTPKAKQACLEGEYLAVDYYGDELCKPCWCSGLSSDCKGVTKQAKPLVVAFEEPEEQHGVTLTPENIPHGKSPKSPVNKNQIKVDPDTNMLMLIDLSKRFLAKAHYFALPAMFTGVKIGSYGGTLKYEFTYNTSMRDKNKPIKGTDVILEGKNKMRLYYDNEGNHPSNGTRHTQNVVLDERNWKDKFGDAVTRNDFMNVIQDLNKVMIRTTYDENQINTGLGNIVLDTSGVDDGRYNGALGANGKEMSMVEVCNCPPEYAGDSCQLCAEGYERSNDETCQPTDNFLKLKENKNDDKKDKNEDKNDKNKDPNENQKKGKEKIDDRNDDEDKGRIEIVDPTRNEEEPTPPPRRTPPTKTDCEQGYAGVDCDECAEGYSMLNGVCTKLPEVGCYTPGTHSVTRSNCNCKPGCEGPTCGQCKPGFFYLAAENLDGCISCWCSGKTSDCKSSDLRRNEIQPEYYNSQQFSIHKEGDKIDNYGRVALIKVNEQSTGVSVQLEDISDGVQYWSLKEKFLGNKLTSYGGNFDYTVSFESIRGEQRPLDDYNVILEGAGVRLSYTGDETILEGSDNLFSVKFREEYWVNENGEQATRDELMTLLTDVETFLVRAAYLPGPSISTLSNVYLETAVSLSNRERAFEVEECVCPEGYQGLSCESCEEGYERIDVFGDFNCRKIEKITSDCECNERSNECDAVTGICLNCRGNFMGDHCELCMDGYFMDPYDGQCKMCPCRQEGLKCTVDNFNNPNCDECPEGYTGSLCNLCSHGYERDTSISEEVVCIKEGSCDCDENGSYGKECGDNGQCKCKEDYEGPSCTECKKGLFQYNLEKEDGSGCTPCFCMGITQQCNSNSKLKRVQINADFASEHFFYLSDIDGSFKEMRDIEYSGDGKEIFYPKLNSIPKNTELYWRFDDDFLGDKVVSYGGKLEFTLTSLPSNLRSRRRFRPKVLISGNNMLLQAVKIKKGENDDALDRMGYVTKLKERSWQHYQEQQPASREDMLMVLADLDAIFVQAKFNNDQRATGIAYVSMETAREDDLQLEPAFAVEQCECPDGYEGFSCEDCAPGYTRNHTGDYLGYCQSCDCNSHSDECDANSGSCLACSGNTEGESCENCKRGFYRHPDEPKTNPCRECPCPRKANCTEAEIPTCDFDSVGDIVCDRCPRGYQGKQCENCADGYDSNPRISGGQCIPVDSKIMTDCTSCRRPPEVEVYPKNVQLREGESLFLNCQVVSPVDATVTWKRVTKAGVDVHELPNTVQVIENGLVLQFRNFRSADAGKFKCVAENKYGEGSDTATVFASNPYIPIKVNIQSPTMKHVVVGQDVEFRCQAQSSSGNHQLRWLRPGRQLPESAYTDDNGLLRVENVQLSDGGLYICVGRDDKGGMNRAASHLIVKQQDKRMPSKVEVLPIKVKVSAGKLARFRCKITLGSPDAELQWRRADGKPLPSNARIEGNYLVIPEASVEDDSMYMCRATNPYGSAEGGAQLQVREKLEPLIISVEPSSPLELFVGDSRVVKCVSPSLPPPKFTWTRTNQEQDLGENVQQGGGYLRFTQVTKENEGLYTCSARNKHSVVELQYQLIVKKRVRKPLCKTVLKEIEIYVGTNSTIRCDVGGNPPPKVTWEGVNGSSIGSNMKVEGTNLKIYGVRLENAGSYECVATNKDGESRSPAKITVKKVELPLVLVRPRTSMKVEEGGAVEMTCSTDQENATVEWKKPEDEDMPEGVSFSKDGKTLKIENASFNHNGKYRCYARNKVGHRYITTMVRVMARPKVFVEDVNDDLEVLLGAPLELRCHASGTPSPSLMWKMIPSSYTLNERTDVRLTKYHRSKVTYRVDEFKEQDSGKYICSATNSVGTSTKSVNVKVVSPVRGVPPTVLSPSKVMKLRVISGEDLRLACNVQGGQPEPVVRWLKNNEVHLSPRKTGNNLKISHANSGHSGNYTCVAANKHGSDHISYLVSILEPPVVELLPDSEVSLHRGDSATITCKLISGTPPVAFEWTRSHKSKFTSPNVNWYNNSLTIENFNPATDSGRYTCQASNDAGSAVATTQVTLSRPPIIVVSPSRETVNKGDDATFTCSVYGDDENDDVTITWSREYSQLEDIRMVVKGNQLIINNVLQGDSGRYKCTAQNKYGTTASYAKLTVNYAPDVKIIINNNENVYEIQKKVEISCLAEGEPRPKVTLNKDGVEIEEFSEESPFTIKEFSFKEFGVYTCVAENKLGSHASRVNLILPIGSTTDKRQDKDSVTLKPNENRGGEIVQVKSGDVLKLQCNTADENLYEWYKNGELLTGNGYKRKVLRKYVYLKDSGSYECKSSRGVVLSEYNVAVEAEIPHFTQTPVSYTSIKLPDNGLLFRGFLIQVSFRPISLEGILLYMDSKMAVDFFSVTLIDGYVEFRFNVGSGTFLARSKEPVTLHDWHTLHIYRDEREGRLSLDDQQEIVGLSPGAFRGLDLDGDLYVGGVPTDKVLNKELEFIKSKTGFYGCISQLGYQPLESSGLLTDRKMIDFSSPAQVSKKVGIFECDVCGNSPHDQKCANNETCMKSHSTMHGFVCAKCTENDSCNDDMKKDLCESKCRNGACIVDKSSKKFYCKCNKGYYGQDCRFSAMIDVMEGQSRNFDDEEELISVIEIAPATTEKPQKLGSNRSIIPRAFTFNGDSFLKKVSKKSPYDQKKFKISMRIRRSTLENGVLFYQTGDENSFIMLSVRNGAINFSFNFGSETATEIQSQPVKVGVWHTVEAKIKKNKSYLFIDGVPDGKAKSKNKNGKFITDDSYYIGGGPNSFNYDGFQGCIDGLKINDKFISFETKKFQFEGVNECVQKASSTYNNYPFQSAARFTRSSYISYTPNIFKHNSQVETVSFKLKTINNNGLILLHGEDFSLAGMNMGKSKSPYIEIGIVEGKVAYNLSTGLNTNDFNKMITMRSKSFVSDGKWHEVVVVREGSHIDIFIDSILDSVDSKSDRNQIDINTIGRVYIGGAPDVIYLTSGRYTEGFVGCLRDFTIATSSAAQHKIDLGHSEAMERINVRECNLKED